MKVIFLFLYLAQLSSAESINDDIENVYIDALIQSYKVLSENLWTFVRENRISQPYVTVNEIITQHHSFFMDKSLEELLFNEFRLKFQFYYETKSFKNCSQEDQLLNLLDELAVPSNIKEKLISTDSRIYCVDGVTSFYKKKAKKPSDLFGFVSKNINGALPIVPKCTPDCSLVKIKCTSIDDLKCGPDEQAAPPNPTICKCCAYCKKLPKCRIDCSTVTCIDSGLLKCKSGEVLTHPEPDSCVCC